jgi:ROS/MUCR transcriptional regulator protein
MSAEIAVRRRAAGVLPDGTAFYAPIGEVLADGSRVVCHLCGRSLRSVAAHLPAHGWTKQEYCAAFGLERRQSLEGPETRKLRAAALASRLIFDPAIREGSAAGRGRALRGPGPRRRGGRARPPVSPAAPG